MLEDRVTGDFAILSDGTKGAASMQVGIWALTNNMGPEGHSWNLFRCIYVRMLVVPYSWPRNESYPLFILRIHKLETFEPHSFSFSIHHHYFLTSVRGLFACMIRYHGSCCIYSAWASVTIKGRNPHRWLQEFDAHLGYCHAGNMSHNKYNMHRTSNVLESIYCPKPWMGRLWVPVIWFCCMSIPCWTCYLWYIGTCCLAWVCNRIYLFSFLFMILAHTSIFVSWALLHMLLSVSRLTSTGVVYTNGWCTSLISASIQR